MKRIDIQKLGTQMGQEISEAKFYEMLEVLPPERQAVNGFLLGEPTDHTAKGEPRYDLYVCDKDKYYEGGTITVRAFDALLVDI